MTIRFHKYFKKQLHKLTSKQRERINEVIKRFQSDPFHPTLSNHPLKGDCIGLRSISAGGDFRLIFRETGGYLEVLFLYVGTHSQLY